MSEFWKRKRIRKSVFKRYAYIVNSMVKTMTKYDIKALPLKTFLNICDKAKFNEPETADELLRFDTLEHAENCNKTIKLIQGNVIANVKQDAFKMVRLDVVESYVAALQASYLKAEQDAKKRKS